jgi:hypothetical protein
MALKNEIITINGIVGSYNQQWNVITVWVSNETKTGKEFTRKWSVWFEQGFEIVELYKGDKISIEGTFNVSIETYQTKDGETKTGNNCSINEPKIISHELNKAGEKLIATIDSIGQDQDDRGKYGSNYSQIMDSPF